MAPIPRNRKELRGAGVDGVRRPRLHPAAENHEEARAVDDAVFDGRITHGPSCVVILKAALRETR